MAERRNDLARRSRGVTELGADATTDHAAKGASRTWRTKLPIRKRDETRAVQKASEQEHGQRRGGARCQMWSHAQDELSRQRQRGTAQPARRLTQARPTRAREDTRCRGARR